MSLEVFVFVKLKHVFVAEQRRYDNGQENRCDLNGEANGEGDGDRVGGNYGAIYGDDNCDGDDAYAQEEVADGMCAGQ